MYVEVQAPEWVTPEHFKKAIPILVRVLGEMKDSDEAKRGYILAANIDGFPIKAGFATGKQLEEICIRAFWWIFERITNGWRRGLS